MTDMSNVEGVLDAITRLSSELEALWQPREDPLPLDDLTLLLLGLTDLQKALGIHVASVEEVITNLMPEKTVKTHWATIERVTSSNKTTWDHDLLMPKVAQAAVDNRQVDPETGEIESVSQAVVRAILECASVSYWRLGKLSEREIDGTKYRSVEWGRKRVKITQRPSIPEQTPDVG